jgi:hypothetical protein
MLTYAVILSLSLIFTPLVVRALINKGVAGVASTLAGGSGGMLVASAGGPATLTALATASTSKVVTGVRHVATLPLTKTRTYFQERRKDHAQEGVKAVPINLSGVSKRPKRNDSTDTKQNRSDSE